jgi:predicted CXXCH cytochrome family protein
VWLFLGALFWLSVGSLAYGKNDFNLKEGARGKLCVDCHEEFQEILKKRFLHTPLQERECTGCHSPHASDHGLLLEAEPAKICYKCHDDVIPANAKSVHEVVIEGKCASCHDPHAADNKNILIRAGSQLCFECHEELGERIAGNEFEHEPVSEDCLECHNPHASETTAKLLKGPDPALCLDCHDADKAVFKRVHQRYPVEKGRCSACHDPHGSSTTALLFDNVHDPVAEGECEECHLAANSRSAFALKDEGYALCEGCHYETVVEALNQKRVHWPLLDKTGCINCHAPHGSAQDALMKEPMIEVCGECHSDTVARQERARTEHPPVANGECNECHLSHGSENLFLAKVSSNVDLCGECHDWETHSSHPIGADVIDPRNHNLAVDCSSCHRTHGTEHKHFIYFDEIEDMCTQCHTDYRR